MLNPVFTVVYKGFKKLLQVWNAPCDKAIKQTIDGTLADGMQVRRMVFRSRSKQRMASFKEALTPAIKAGKEHNALGISCCGIGY